MDKNKYVVSLNDNKDIEWVGVKNLDDIVLYNITGYTNRDEYLSQLAEVERKHPGFLTKIYNEDYTVVDSEWFKAEELKIIKENTTPAKTVVVEEIDNEDNKKFARDAVLGGIVTALSVAAIAVMTKCGADKVVGKAELNNNPVTIEADVDSAITTVKDVVNEETTTTDNVSLENKTVAELLNMLEDNGQKEAFTKITTAQDDFNEDAAPTVKMPEHEVKDFDENGNIVTEIIPEKQLFLTFDEVSSLYLYANAFEVPAEDLAMYFGNAKVFDQKPNGKIKESLNQNIVTTNFETASQVLNMYYNLDATVHTGIDQVFENEEEAKFFYDFESLVLSYNESANEETAKEIREKLQEIFINGTLDSLKDKYPGATAIISTTMLTWAQQQNIIDKEKMETYYNIAETVTCNDIKEQLRKVEEIIDCEVQGDCANVNAVINGKERIIEEIDRKQDEQTLKLDRAYYMRQSIEGYNLDDLFAAGGFVNGEIVENSESHTYSNESASRSEAVNLAGESAVKKAESNANQSNSEKNAKENKKEKDMKQGNNDAVDTFINSGGKETAKTDSSKSNEYNEAVDKTNKTIDDALKAKEEYDKTHDPVIKVETEEIFVPENNTNTKSESKSSSTKVETIEEPKQEIPTYKPEVKETFVEESKTVTSVEHHETYEEIFVEENEQGKAKVKD